MSTAIHTTRIARSSWQALDAMGTYAGSIAPPQVAPPPVPRARWLTSVVTVVATLIAVRVVRMAMRS